MKLILLCLGVLGLGAFFSPSASGETRQPAVAGQFYPNNPDELSAMVNRHLNEVTDLPEIDGQIIALICPHAGLIYSGHIAAYSYKLLENSKVDKVILCGPAHRVRFEGISVYAPGVDWLTPLGIVHCNNDLCTRMIESNKEIRDLPEPHRQEHCLEVQLPYLQTVLKDFTLVPALMGRPTDGTIDILVNALNTIPQDESTVMIASTDWQHYMPASEGWKYDSLGLDCLEKLDPNRLEDYLAEGKTQMCGGGCAVAVMRSAMHKGANRIKILKYGDSGDVTGDKSSVVSYVAAVLYKADDDTKKSSKKESIKSTETMTISDEDKHTLLKIARESITAYLTTGRMPTFDVSDNLKQLGAAFVTLTKNGRLRGCIGQTVATAPLYETVSHCAIQAAVSDPRFPPVTAGEVDNLHIEISVLTPLQKIESLDDIEVGRDGLMIVLGSNRGLLLPQVATDYGWDRTEFLEHTCNKAGLNPDAYKSDMAEIYTFRALIFEEEH